MTMIKLDWTEPMELLEMEFAAEDEEERIRVRLAMRRNSINAAAKTLMWYRLLHHIDTPIRKAVTARINAPDEILMRPDHIY